MKLLSNPLGLQRGGTRQAAPRPAASAGTPAVLAAARERGVDLTQITGTGAGGRITKADVHAAAGHTSPQTPQRTTNADQLYAAAWGNGSTASLGLAASTDAELEQAAGWSE